MERAWLVRGYREGDEQGIFELWKAVYPGQYNKQQWMRWWRWRYKDNPAGGSKILLAEHDGRIVGHRAVIFINMKIGSEVVKAHQAGNLMTHPDYRNQGVSSTLERTSLDELESDGVNIGLNFPSEAEYPRHAKQGYFYIATTRILFRPFNWRNTLKTRTRNKLLLSLGTIGGNILQKVVYRARKAPAVEGLKITPISSFDERINEFWDRVSRQYPIMVVRNKDYLNWRYVAIPDVDYSIYIAEKADEICGYLVLRYMGREGVKEGVVFDIIAQSEEIAHCLISRAVEQCQQAKMDLISCPLIARETLLKVFRRNGFVSLFTKGIWFCIYSSSPHFSREFLKDSRNWLVQLGDSDAI